MSKELSTHSESVTDAQERPFVEDPAMEKRFVVTISPGEIARIADKMILGSFARLTCGSSRPCLSW